MTLEPASKTKRNLVQKALEPDFEEGERSITLNQRVVDKLLGADGDGNPIHGPKPLFNIDTSLSGRVPKRSFGEYISEVYDVIGAFADLKKT